LFFLSQHNLIAALFSYDGFIYVRLSAQIYNTIDDYQKLVDLVKLELQHQ
jgi:selenocysteine lyase/cysteine desulfurase